MTSPRPQRRPLVDGVRGNLFKVLEYTDSVQSFAQSVAEKGVVGAVQSGGWLGLIGGAVGLYDARKEHLRATTERANAEELRRRARTDREWGAEEADRHLQEADPQDRRLYLLGQRDGIAGIDFPVDLATRGDASYARGYADAGYFCERTASNGLREVQRGYLDRVQQRLDGDAEAGAADRAGPERGRAAPADQRTRAPPGRRAPSSLSGHMADPDERREINGRWGREQAQRDFERARPEDPRAYALGVQEGLHPDGSFATAGPSYDAGFAQAREARQRAGPDHVTGFVEGYGDWSPPATASGQHDGAGNGTDPAGRRTAVEPPGAQAPPSVLDGSAPGAGLPSTSRAGHGAELGSVPSPGPGQPPASPAVTVAPSSPAPIGEGSTGSTRAAPPAARPQPPSPDMGDGHSAPGPQQPVGQGQDRSAEDAEADAAMEEAMAVMRRDTEKTVTPQDRTDGSDRDDAGREA